MPAQQEILNVIKSNVLFSGFEDGLLLQSIGESIEKRTISAGENLFVQADSVDGLYLISSGQIQVYSERAGGQYVLSYAEAGHLVGEFLPRGHSVRSVSAQAKADSILYFLSASHLKQLLQQFPVQGRELSLRITRRLFWNQTILALHMCHLFEGLADLAIRALVKDMEILSVASDSLLIKQGQASDNIYVVVNGRFQVYRIVEQEEEFLRFVGRGESLGELGVITQSLRSANVLAVRDSTVARLSKASYETILKNFPVEINRTFFKSGIQHFAEDKADIFKPSETFVLANLISKESPVLIRQLTESLGLFGLTIFIDSAKVDEAFGQDNMAQTGFDSEYNQSLMYWLSEQEVAHRYVVYVIDDSMTAWTKRCLRQADHLLVMIDSDQEESKPQEKLIYAALQGKKLKKTLLLYHHTIGAVTSNSKKCISSRQIDMYHHIRAGVEADFNRLARFLVGRAIGLVLGGGGARGFAHIGVIRAFIELNIPIDLVGGNSMGALIAAQYAMQWTLSDMLKQTLRLCLQGDTFTLPIMSLFSGKKMTSGLRNMFADSGIEDLWLHFFSVSCNISRANIVTHDSGSLLTAVLSSNAPPGLFPPQVVEGDLLVDGALLNNVPVDIMAKKNAGGTIIAVDVNVREDLLDNRDNCGGVSGWHLLMNKLNPFAEKSKIPNLIEILSRASIIGGLAQRKKGMAGLADLYLQPPVNNFPLMAYKQAEQIEEAGYQYAMEVLQKWLESRVDGRPELKL